MAVIDNAAFGRTGRISFLDSAVQFFASVNASIAIAAKRYMLRRNTEIALRGLTDRQLADIGVARSEIGHISAVAVNRL